MGSHDGDNTARATDKRRAQRVRLYSPIAAVIEGTRATLVDLSAEGARIEVPHTLSVGSTASLLLTLDGRTIEVACTVMRCRLDRSIQRDAIVYTAGLHFESADLSDVRAMLESVVGSDFDARRSYT